MIVTEKIDIKGKEITALCMTLVNKKQAAGRYEVQWDASGFASGIYIYQLKAKGQGQTSLFTKKLLLLK